MIFFNIFFVLGVILRTSHRIHLQDDGQILRISQIRSEDAGLYTCDAENSLQRISAATDLRVRDPSKSFSKISSDFIISNSTTVLLSTYGQSHNI